MIELKKLQLLLQGVDWRGTATDFVRHVHEEYPVNVIVEPGVADEVKNYIPFAYTPPNDGSFPSSRGIQVDKDRHSCGTSSYSGCDHYTRWRWNNSSRRIPILFNVRSSNSLLLPGNTQLSPPIQYLLLNCAEPKLTIRLSRL